MSGNEETNKQMRPSGYIRPTIYVIIAVFGVVTLYMKQTERQNTQQERVKEQIFDRARTQCTALFCDSLQQVKQ